MSLPYSLTKNYQLLNSTQPISVDVSNFFSPIHNTPMTKLPPGADRNFSPKLAPRNLIKNPIKKKTLILDLDETLVHSSMRPFPKFSDITLPLKFNGKNVFVYVLKRPFLEKFLKEMSLIYDIIIFTASLPEYAEPLLDILDKDKVIKYRLNRSHCRHYQNIYIKDLKVINRDLKDMIIIDNNPESYLMNQENAIPILTWEDDENDNELDKLIPVLKYLSKVTDVRDVINKIVDRNNEKVDFQAFNKLINSNNNLRNEILLNNLNIVTNDNIINANSNRNIIINNKRNININTKYNEPKNNIINYTDINYNKNKRIYIRKEIAGNSNINKRISFPNNTTNKYKILNNKNYAPSLGYPQDNQNNLYPKDNDRKNGKKELKLGLDVVGLKDQNSNNLALNNRNRLNKEIYRKELMNNSPVNQINVSNSTINIFNNNPGVNILVKGPNRNSDLNEIKKIKQENLTPIRTVKKNNIVFSEEKKVNIITPIKENNKIYNNYNNYLPINPNLGKTIDNKISKTVSVRKLFERSNHSFDNIAFLNDKNKEKLKKIKIKNIEIINNNEYSYPYNQNLAKYPKTNNVKNNNIYDNKTNKIEIWNSNNNYNNLRYQKSMNNFNLTTKIKKIEVVKSKNNVKSPERRRNIKVKVKEKENIPNIEFNNTKVKRTKKIIMEREAFNREEFLKENFGIVD